MEDLSQTTVTKEMFYLSQKAMSDTIKELSINLKDIKIGTYKLTETVNLYIQDDTDWKKTAQPVIEMGNSARGASKVVLYLAGVIITIGGAFEIIRNFLKKNI